MLYEVITGKGLATRLLLEMNPAGADPLGPENRLIFATGPFCGTRLWGGSRYGVFTKSPLTGLYCESYSGGKMPEALDAAGYDAVVIHGQAERPLALSVHPSGCDFHDASDLWGADNFTAETEALERVITSYSIHYTKLYDISEAELERGLSILEQTLNEVAAEM